jgi:hypothetical protein
LIEAKKINEVQEVNIFKDDNTVIHFKKPSLDYSFKEKVSFLSGLHEEKNIKDLLPTLIKQLGPKQFEFMKEYAETLKKKDIKKSDKTEEAPELVEDFEEVSKQGEKKEEKKPEEKKEEKKPEEKKPEEKKPEEKKPEEKKEEKK